MSTARWKAKFDRHLRQEATSDGSGGTYVVVTQGAVLAEFRYIRKKDGKTFTFEEDPDASGENGCEWKAK